MHTIEELKAEKKRLEDAYWAACRKERENGETRSTRGYSLWLKAVHAQQKLWEFNWAHPEIDKL